jgi:hypothetical protein
MRRQPMEPQRFWIHFTLVLTVFFAFTVSEIVSSAGAGSGTTAGGTDVPPEGGFANPLPGASTGPTTGGPHDSKATEGTGVDRSRFEPGASAHDRVSPRKSPSSHAEKHPDYDRMDSENQKALQKESH